MKKIIALILALVLAVSLTACKSGDESDTSSTTDADNSNTSTEANPTCKFPNYTGDGDWPSAEVWADMGLPDLYFDGAGNTTILTKNQIESLDADDGVLIWCRPTDPQFAYLVERLEEAGIVGIDRSDEFDSIYEATYLYGGRAMRVTLSEYADDGRLTVLVRYRPH